MSALDGIRRFRQYLQPAQRRAFDQAMESAQSTMPPPADDFGEEGDPNGNGGEGEHHVHIHLPTPGAHSNGGGEMPPTEEADQLGGEGGNDPEKEEIWQAIENLERAVVTGDSAGFRDAWPHRDARRAKFGIDRRQHDQEREDNLETGETGDEGQSATTAANKTLIKAFELEAPPGAATDLRRAHDSRMLQDGMQQLMSDIEILVPGYRFPAFDARQAPARTVDQMCRLRRHAIELSYNQPEGRSLIERATRGRFQGSTRGMDCGAVKQVFDHMVDLRRTDNNTGPGVGFVREAPDAGFGGINASRFSSPAEMQKAMDEYYTQHPRTN